jgi:hypothetical protein
MFSICIDLLRAHLVYDLGMHQTILSLACNLFLASEFKPTADTSKVMIFKSFVLSSVINTLGNHLLHQCIVITVYQNVLGNQQYGGSKVLFVSCNFSCESFSQKLEIDKKISGMS